MSITRRAEVLAGRRRHDIPHRSGPIPAPIRIRPMNVKISSHEAIRGASPAARARSSHDSPLEELSPSRPPRRPAENATNSVTPTRADTTLSTPRLGEPGMNLEPRRGATNTSATATRTIPRRADVGRGRMPPCP